jgi:hypothetical protein
MCGRLASEHIQVDIVAAATESACAGEWVSFRVNAECLVSLDKFAFQAVALATVASAAHDDPP